MPYTYTLTSIIPAAPQEIYDAWLDSLAHSRMTGGEANMSDEVGAEVSAWGDYIKGRNLALIPGKRIVQSWRTTRFTDEHEDSTITVTLAEMDDGTLLTLVHGNVPDDQRNYEEGGWESNYFEPMKIYFGNLKRATVGRSPKRAASKTGRKVAAGKKSNKPASRAKASGGKRKSKRKRAVAAKAKAKSAKPAARKAVRRAAAKSKSGRRKRTGR